MSEHMEGEELLDDNEVEHMEEEGHTNEVPPAVTNEQQAQGGQTTNGNTGTTANDNVTQLQGQGASLGNNLQPQVGASNSMHTLYSQ